MLRLRRDGAFVAVPLWRVNLDPIGPHPAGSYEIWCPKESFAEVFSYLTLNRGELSVLVHPLTREERKDHEVRRVWMGPEYRLDLDTLPRLSPQMPSQYHSLSTFTSLYDLLRLLIALQNWVTLQKRTGRLGKSSPVAAHASKRA